MQRTDQSLLAKTDLFTENVIQDLLDAILNICHSFENTNSEQIHFGIETIQRVCQYFKLFRDHNLTIVDGCGLSQRVKSSHDAENV